MHGHFQHFLEDFDHQIDNKGEELVITVKGDPAELTKLEKALNALKDLHEACGDDCCGGHCC